MHFPLTVPERRPTTEVHIEDLLFSGGVQDTVDRHHGTPINPGQQGEN